MFNLIKRFLFSRKLVDGLIHSATFWIHNFAIQYFGCNDNLIGVQIYSVVDVGVATNDPKWNMKERDNLHLFYALRGIDANLRV